MVVLVVVLLVLLIVLPIVGWALWLLITTALVGAIIGGFGPDPGWWTRGYAA